MKMKYFEDQLKKMTGLNEQEMFAAMEFMKGISVEGIVGQEELAVFLFRNKFEFENLVVSFDPAQSSIIQGYERFGSNK
jgi:hypothetical protein